MTGSLRLVDGAKACGDAEVCGHVSSNGGGSEASSGPDTQEGPPDRHAIGELQAGLALFKAIIGPSILFLPAGMRNAGMLAAAGISVAVGGVTAWCMLLVLDTAACLRCRGVRATDFGDVGAAAFGPQGRLAVEAAIVVSQLGFCIAYCVFVAGNVQVLIFESQGGVAGVRGQGRECHLGGVLGDEKLVDYIILVLIPLLIPTTWVRQLRFFWPTNLLASLLVVASVLYMLAGFALQIGRGAGSDLRALNMFEPRGALVFLGTSAYAFEGIGMLLPVERAMREPSRMPRVVLLTVGGACALQVMFACTAYVLFGRGTQSIITVSLGDTDFWGGEAAVAFVQSAWIFVVLLTFPLQLFPAAGIIERRWLPERRSGFKWTKNAIRTVLLLFCMAVSTVGYRSVDNLVALIGALGCVPLAIVYPALFHFKICHRPPRPGPDERVEALLSGCHSSLEMPPSSHSSTRDAYRDLVLVVIGVCGTLVSAALAVHSWVTSSFQLQVCILSGSAGAIFQ